MYESYDPLRLKQNEGQELLAFTTFDAALDEFYAKVIVLQRLHVVLAVLSDRVWAAFWNVACATIYVADVPSSCMSR